MSIRNSLFAESSPLVGGERLKKWLKRTALKLAASVLANVGGGLANGERDSEKIESRKCPHGESLFAGRAAAWRRAEARRVAWPRGMLALEARAIKRAGGRNEINKPANHQA